MAFTRDTTNETMCDMCSQAVWDASMKMLLILILWYVRGVGLATATESIRTSLPVDISIPADQLVGLAGCCWAGRADFDPSHMSQI